MRRLRTPVFVSAFALFALGCSSKKQVMNAKKEKDYGTPKHILSDYNLVWKDDFEGASLDLKKMELPRRWH